MIQPTFSICIPNYNYAHYIGETIQSVLHQSYPYFEVIVADNASTDNSIQVVEAFRDERVRLVRNHYNIGFAPNLQRASATAKNEFMIMLSADDRMGAGALETYARVIESLGDSAYNTLVYSRARHIDGQGHASGLLHPNPSFYQKLESRECHTSDGINYYLYGGQDVLREALRVLSSPGPFLSLAYPRRLFEAVEGYNSVHLTDPDTHFAFKLLEQNPQVVWLNEPLFDYRIHNANQLSLQQKQGSIKKPIDKYLYTVDVSDKLLQQLGLVRQELIAAFVRRYLVDEMFHYLARGFYMQAYRGLAFALATYPGQVLRTPRAYLLAMLLLIGPVSAPVTRFIRDLYRRLGGKE